MKNRRLIVAISIIAASAALLIAFFILQGGHEEVKQPQAGTQGAPPAATGAGESMPGMPGMENTPPQGGETEEETPTVEITEDMQHLIGVKTAEASLKDMTKTTRLTGRIGYDEKNLSTVNTKVEGWIERLYVDYEGRYLKKGEPVADIYSPELFSAQQELISLLASKKTPGRTPESSMIDSDWNRLTYAARKRLRLWDISEGQIRQIERSGKPVKTLTLSSPVSGYVVKKYATRGVKVMPGEPLLDIVNLSQVWVIAEVSEPDVDLVKVGMPVRITIAGLPGQVFTSKIDYVYPTMSAETRTLRVRATLPNPDDILKPQMYAVVEIKADLGRKLLVPQDAVIDTGERQIVYVDRGEGNFEPRVVTAGMRSDGMREIISGLKPGERVASSALFLIDSEAQLKGVSPAPSQGAAPASPQGQVPEHAGHQH